MTDNQGQRPSHRPVRSRTGRVVAAAAAAFLASSLVMVQPCAASDKQAELDAANRRWRGARCRTRQLVEIKKGEARDGWSKSKWLFWSPKGGNERARLWFSDGGAVRRMLGGSLLPIGTELVAKGWAVENGDLFLELELANLPVAVKVYYWDDWVGRVSMGRIEDFERWARFDLFELLSSPEEELVEVARRPRPQAHPRPTARQVQPGRKPAAAYGVAALRVLSASVEPVRVSPGQEVQLVIVYNVAGVPPGAEIEVLETRTVVKDGRRLTSIEARARRQSGAHESRQSLRLPVSLAAGVYELEVEVQAGEARSKQTTIFEVKSSG